MNILYVFSTLILPTDKMAEDGETKVAKRGRGRPPKAESEKKTATKRAAPAPAAAAAGGAKKGRGRPPKAEAAPAKKVRKIVLKLCIKMFLF